MIFTSSRYKERSKGLQETNYILGNKSDIFSIHYSCESFTKSKSSTPRVTSISIYNIKTKEQICFNIHIEAQLRGYNCMRLSGDELDASERSLLQQFYKFVKNHQGCIWVHWNMKNYKYGFEALSIRYKLLTRRSAPKLKAHDHYNLDVLLRKLYGHNFEVNSCHSKLLNLSQRNNIPIKGMLLGIEEAKAFTAKNYQAIMESSQSKAEAIGLIIKAAGEKGLKVNASLREIYGISLLSVLLFIGDNFTKIKRIASAIGSLLIMLLVL
ncbi:hypothetical protein [Pontibacter ramchanderi]|uniref:Uncharacterized protein n=1 Tax=Pontibacter ramchanderi TaxID=1179743 RepID=A0A2N3UD49_9BACT|nr:hypothetical protein [Pontibacter ramchanderi]PKV67308.1 hypothetical protein BD749_2450 [Pontibacter ramchanderi]